MMRALAVAVVVALSSCATTPAGQTAAAVTSDPMFKAGLTALAGQLGIPETYVTLAATVAQTLIGQGKDVPTAVKGGVDEATEKATKDGTPLTTDQVGGLLKGLPGLFGGSK